MPDTALLRLGETIWPQHELSAEAIALLQLRHLTKNALQRIIGQIAASGLRATPSGERLADDLERRIFLSARLSDALFGLTAAPGSLRDRLAGSTEACLAMLADQEQTISTEITVAGRCPPAVDSTLVQAAHEMVGNAVKHGMHMRLQGRITVHVRGPGAGGHGDGVTLLVSDDGWGPCHDREGQGLSIMRMLAARHGGAVALYREGGWTVARLHLPASGLTG